MILGDVAYPQAPFIISPYRVHEALGDPERHQFNEKLSLVRIAVEHTFGILKEKWVLIARPLVTNQEYYRPLILAVCILHNLTLTQ